ncbi:MAG: membrane protein insertion efficiency factor YidD [Sedimentisphaerales bacterium]|nr:membrane protein insertion efficiency factor YidD [Sedimentisphaerales bacterium]
MNCKIGNILIRSIMFYQKKAPAWMHNMCRYTPTCSEYAILVIREKGALLGSICAFLRILRCIPPFGGTDWPRNGDNNSYIYKDSLHN